MDDIGKCTINSGEGIHYLWMYWGKDVVGRILWNYEKPTNVVDKSNYMV